MKEEIDCIIISFILNNTGWSNEIPREYIGYDVNIILKIFSIEKSNKKNRLIKKRFQEFGK